VSDMISSGMGMLTFLRGFILALKALGFTRCHLAGFTGKR
jgi:hypothetical protein